MVDGGQRGSRFFYTSAIAITLLTALSFSHTYFTPMVTGSRSFTLLRHLHGLAFFAWIGLFVAQTWLIRAGKVRLHRDLGTLTIALAGAMVPLGIWQAVSSAEERLAKGFAMPFEWSIYNLVDIVVFATAFGWAIHEATRRIEWHRRLMFVAMLNLFGPAFSRMTLLVPLPFPLSDMAPNLVADAVLILLALHDRRQLGVIHPVTKLAMGILIPFHAVEPLIARSQAWNSVAPSLFGFW